MNTQRLFPAKNPAKLINFSHFPCVNETPTVVTWVRLKIDPYKDRFELDHVVRASWKSCSEWNSLSLNFLESRNIFHAHRGHRIDVELSDRSGSYRPCCCGVCKTISAVHTPPTTMTRHTCLF